MVGFFLGRSFGPATVDFPDRDEIRNAAEMELAVDEALRIPRAFVRTVTLVRLFEGLDSQNVERGLPGHLESLWALGSHRPTALSDGLGKYRSRGRHPRGRELADSVAA